MRRVPSSSTTTAPRFETVELPYDPDRDVVGPQPDVVVNPRVRSYESLISAGAAQGPPGGDRDADPQERGDELPCRGPLWASRPAADARSSVLRRHALVHRLHGPAVPHRSRPHRRPPGDDRHRSLGGPPVQTGVVSASRDALAADTVGAALLGFDIQAVLWEAARLGVGEPDNLTVRVPGALLAGSGRGVHHARVRDRDQLVRVEPLPGSSVGLGPHLRSEASMNAGRSSGIREVTRFRSVTTASFTTSTSPTMWRSLRTVGHAVIRRPLTRRRP